MAGLKDALPPISRRQKDATHLNVVNWVSPAIHRMDTEGNMVNTKRGVGLTIWASAAYEKATSRAYAAAWLHIRVARSEMAYLPDRSRHPRPLLLCH